jgi:hypothetical protein
MFDDELCRITWDDDFQYPSFSISLLGRLKERRIIYELFFAGVFVICFIGGRYSFAIQKSPTRAWFTIIENGFSSVNYVSPDI